MVAALDALVDARKVLIRNFIVEFYTNSLDCHMAGSRPAATPEAATNATSGLPPVAAAAAKSASDGKSAAKQTEAEVAPSASSSSTSEAGHRLFLYMSRRLHADSAALQAALDACTGASPVSAVSVSALIRATALARLRLGALLKTFDRAFAPRTDRMMPRANRAGAAMRLGTGAGAARLYCGRRLGRALIPGSADGQCGPLSGAQCADCAAEVVASAAIAAVASSAAVTAASSTASSAPAAPEPRAQWQCAACTLLNAANANVCAVCDAARP